MMKGRGWRGEDGGAGGKNVEAVPPAVKAGVKAVPLAGPSPSSPPPLLMLCSLLCGACTSRSSEDTSAMEAHSAGKVCEGETCAPLSHVALFCRRRPIRAEEGATEDEEAAETTDASFPSAYSICSCSLFHRSKLHRKRPDAVTGSGRTSLGRKEHRSRGCNERMAMLGAYGKTSSALPHMERQVTLRMRRARKRTSDGRVWR